MSGVPLIGKALKDVPLSASLLGDWPFAGTWRLLMLAPVVGLLLGGAFATHEDETKTTVSGVVIHELDGGYKRHLTPEELRKGPPV